MKLDSRSRLIWSIGAALVVLSALIAPALASPTVVHAIRQGIDELTNLDRSTLAESNPDQVPSQVRVTVIQPNGDESLPVGATYNIIWEAPTPPAYTPQTFRLLYSTDGGTSWRRITTVGFLIREYGWEVPPTPSSRCRVRVEEMRGSVLMGWDMSDGNFTIGVPPTPTATPIRTPTPPPVRVTRPNGGESWQVGTTEEIRWDYTGTATVTTFSLDYSTDGGASWTAITTVVGTTRSYSWLVPNTPSTRCRVRVKPIVYPFTLGSDVSDGDFTIYAPAPTPTFTPTPTRTPVPPTPTRTPTPTPAPLTPTPTPTIPPPPLPFTPTPTSTPTPTANQIQLSAGWNLISVPKALQDPSISAVFAANPAVIRVTTSQGGTWTIASRVDGGWSGTLTQIVDGLGYYAYATAPSTLTLQFKPPDPLALPPSYSLPAGWSLIGFTSSIASMPVDTYLATLAGKWTSLYRYDPTAGWELARPGGVGFTDMEMGRGYWIELTSAGTLVP